VTLPKIISSGIPGAESAALDVAIRLDVPYGGYAMDNSMLDAYRATRRYKLWEKSFQTSRAKDEANLHIADATLIFTHGELNRDLFFIDDYSVTHGRPSYHVDFNVTDPLQAAFQISIWTDKHNPKSIFVAGSRERIDKEIYQATFGTLFSFISLKRGEHPEPDRLTVDKKPWPKTVEEAIQNLIELLALKDKVAFAKMTADEVADLNLTLGNFIRNSFGLWADNQELMRSCSKAAGKEITHQDTASAVIIEKLVSELAQTHKLRKV
jgi:hypothetical protein